MIRFRVMTRGKNEMAIAPDDVVLGWIYLTPGKAERLVTSIGNGKVHYLRRSHNLKNDWGYGSGMAGTKLETFAKACSKKLGRAAPGL
jgi:hypothetical protein